MKVRFVFSALALIVLTHSGWAQDRAQAQQDEHSCLDEKKVSALFRSYTWNVQTSRSGKPAEPKFDSCDSSRLSYKVFKALMMIEDFPRLTQKNDELDRNTLGSSATRFFQSRIDRIVLDSGDSLGCRDNDTLAYVWPDEDKTVHICPLSNEFATTSLMATLIHEARHIDGYDHVNCRQGPLAGKDACDPSYSYQGSYAVEAQFHIRVSRTESLDEKLRLSSRASALQRLFVNFNQLPLGLHEGIYLVDHQDLLSFYDGTSAEPVLASVPQDGVFATRAFLPVWFLPAVAKVLAYAPGFGMVNAAGDLASDFVKSKPEKQAQLKDVLYRSNAAIDLDCLLFTDELVCGANSQTVRIPLSKIRPVRLMSLGRALGILSEDGFIYRFDHHIRNLKQQSENDFVKVSNSLQVSQVVAWPLPIQVGLDQKGQVVKFQPGARTTSPVPSLQGRTFRAIQGPAIWSKKLETL